MVRGGDQLSIDNFMVWLQDSLGVLLVAAVFFYGGLKFLHWGRTGVLDRRDIRDNPSYMKLATACGYFSIGFSVFIVCLMFFLKWPM